MSGVPYSTVFGRSGSLSCGSQGGRIIDCGIQERSDEIDGGKKKDLNKATFDLSLPSLIKFTISLFVIACWLEVGAIYGETFTQYVNDAGFILDTKGTISYRSGPSVPFLVSRMLCC